MDQAEGGFLPEENNLEHRGEKNGRDPGGPTDCLWFHKGSASLTYFLHSHFHSFLFPPTKQHLREPHNHLYNVVPETKNKVVKGCRFCPIFSLLLGPRRKQPSTRNIARGSRLWKTVDRTEQWLLQGQEPWNRTWGMEEQLPGDDSEGTRVQLFYSPTYTKGEDLWRGGMLMLHLLLAEEWDNIWHFQAHLQDQLGGKGYFILVMLNKRKECSSFNSYL